jgi:hypothetical protein
MHLNYLGQNFLSLGHPGNSGDGIRLAAELGADLWHMNAVAATPRDVGSGIVYRHEDAAKAAPPFVSNFR